MCILRRGKTFLYKIHPGAAILFFVTVIHLVFSYTWIDFVSTFPEECFIKSILEVTTTPFVFLLSGCIGLGIISAYVYLTVKKQRFRATIRKLSLQGNDIELFENNTDSFFDKYLNEVLYLFESSDVDGIVFEDMDRYELEGIFERLREINTLANIRLSGKGKVIRFFFLLRDDLFVSKDRTKFFDIIIPVVPVVDSSNSYDQLIGHMEKNGFNGKFKDSFLQGLSLYIVLMLSYDYGFEEHEEIRHSNYTLIISRKDSSLYRYIQAEIQTYMDVMLEFCDESIMDSEEAILDILNNPQVTGQQKQQYIGYLDSQITTLQDVQDESLWNVMLEQGVIVYSDQNLVDYWLKAKSFDQALVGFINNCGQDISLHLLKKQDKDLQSKMFSQIVETTSINNISYIQMLKSLSRYYGSGFGVVGVPEEKIKLLFDSKIVRMTEDNLKDIRKNYPNVIYYFIRINLEEYLEIMTTQLLVHEEVLELLSWDIEDASKIALLKLSNSPISVDRKNYTEEVTAYILHNRLDTKDIPVLYADFGQQPNVVQTFVVKYAEKQIDSIISGKAKTAVELKINLLASDNVNQDKKLKLLLTMLPNISKDDCKTCFDTIGLTEFSKIFETYAKPKIQKNQNNQQILDAMIARRWLYDYRESPYDNNFYMVRRKEPTKKRSSE